MICRQKKEPPKKSKDYETHWPFFLVTGIPRAEDWCLLSYPQLPMGEPKCASGGQLECSEHFEDAKKYMHKPLGCPAGGVPFKYQIMTIGEVPPWLINYGLLIRVWHYVFLRAVVAVRKMMRTV